MQHIAIRGMRNEHKKAKGGYHLRDQGGYGRIILKWMLKVI
jgi:hypothetical protein